MESEKQLGPGVLERKNRQNSKAESKSLCLEGRGLKNPKSTPKLRTKESYSKPSMIPVLKSDSKCDKYRVKEFPVPANYCAYSVTEKQGFDYDLKLKELQDKKKSIEEYYLKIEDLLGKKMTVKETFKKTRIPQQKSARKMISDPLVFSATVVREDALSDFESNIRQISDIWLKTSTDLSNTLKTLKNNPSLDPMEFEVENIRIQMAIKQAKSLTLVKTRNVISEAKKLFHHRQMIRNELEKILSTENIKLDDRKWKSPNDKNDKNGPVGSEKVEKPGSGGTGDSTKERNVEGLKKPKENKTDKERRAPNNTPGENPPPKEKPKNSDAKQDKPTCKKTASDTAPDEVQVLATEVAKKNETITNLNKKIFELQKSYNEQSFKYNQLQVTLSEFHEKIQWNKVLWKQIGKMNEQVTGLQQSNKQLEAQKLELESKIKKLDQELNRLSNLNKLFNQKKISCNPAEGKKCQKLDTPDKFNWSLLNEIDVEERILSEKQQAINQLKTVLSAMKDQEISAQNQISMFQSKIEALEKSVRE